MHTPTLFSSNLKICFAILLLTMALASIHPLEFSSYLLHQAGTLICMGFLGWVVKKAHISNMAIIGATVFLLVHILGARYLYSYTPYSEWTQTVFGFSLDTVMGWQRNMGSSENSDHNVR